MAKKNDGNLPVREKKMPYIHFYPSVWRSDIKVQSMTSKSKHVWIETLLIMAEADERGKLVMNGKPISLEYHARLVGYSVEETKVAIDEIIASGVAYVDTSGIMYNKRMVDDMAKYTQDSLNGQKGGNPALKKLTNKDKPTDKGGVNPGDALPLNLNDTVNDTVNDINILKKEKSIVDNKLSTHPDKPGIEFILKFNLLKGTADKPTSYKISPGIKNELSKRLKDYSLEQILTAASNCKEDKFHKENTKYLTPSFILRPEMLEKYLNCEKQVKETQGKYVHIPSRRIQEKLDALNKPIPD